MTSCDDCDGTGFSDDDCKACNGHGVVYMPLEEPCDVCDGGGEQPCGACDGRGYFDDVDPE